MRAALVSIAVLYTSVALAGSSPPAGVTQTTVAASIAAIAPSLAPVQSVNGSTGAVTVPAIQRQVSTAIDATSGIVAWTFPTPFANMPTCFQSLVTTATTYSFDYPLVTAISLSAVSVKVTAHPSSLSITSLALPIALPLTVNPPAVTTLTLSCIAPLP